MDRDVDRAALGRRVAERRAKKGLSQTALAAAVGMRQQGIGAIESGSSARPRFLKEIAAELETTEEWLLWGIGSEEASADSVRSVPVPTPVSRPEPNVRLDKAEPAPDAYSRYGGPRDVPVRGTAVGGSHSDADFSFNGDTIDFAPRPPGIAHRKDVYVLYVENDSMYPRFKPGTRLYVDPRRAPHVDDDVVIELKPGEDGEPGAGFIKTLVRRTPTKIVVKQFNPPKELEFDRDEVKELHRVIPQDELLGI